MNGATAAAARLLRAAEEGYTRVYGSVPLDKRVELAAQWINLARVEAGQAEEPR